MPVTVTLPDGKALELEDGATGTDAAAAIGSGLARAALAIEVSDSAGVERPHVLDLARALPDGARVSIITDKSGEKALELIRHDAAHVLAAAVLELYGGVKISIGPAIEDGFYYDFEFPEGTAVSEADFPKIEERMRAHIKAAEPFERQDVTVAETRERFVAERQDYKVELIDDLVTGADEAHPLRTVSLYTNDGFTDLCRGPHAPSTKTVSAFGLQSVAGAYWRGDSTRKMLTRIYGTAFFSKAALEEYLEGGLREERGSVDTREHLPGRVPAPVGARDRLQPEGAHRLRARSMRAAAQIGEPIVRVQRHGAQRVRLIGARDEVVDQLDLVVLTLR